MRKLYAVLGLFFVAYHSDAQSFVRAGEWKRYRKEVFVSLGSVNFLGDLGGTAKAGRDYSPADLDFSQTRTAFGLGARYKIKRYLNVAGKFNYLILKGDDAKSENPARKNRNLNFRSSVFELSTRAEVGLQTSRTSATRYSIKKTYSAAAKKFTHNIFGFVGVGVFYFNPKGKNAAGKYVALRPLHTEGQGLPGGPKQYSNIAVCVPIGVFYKLNINKIWSLGVEVAFRKTFTDYIDDVGSSYYDASALAAAYGPESAQMADPSRGDIYGASLPAADGTAAQRGDKQRDFYMTFEVTAGYIFKQKRKSARLRSKF
ncbi:MAG: hypothetical protein V4635_00495 [Bacteroidota bacterium]